MATITLQGNPVTTVGELPTVVFRYGQRHSAELDAAKKVAVALGVNDHKIIDIKKEIEISYDDDGIFDIKEKDVI